MIDYIEASANACFKPIPGFKPTYYNQFTVSTAPIEKRLEAIEARLTELEKKPDWSKLIKEAAKSIPKQPTYVPWYPQQPYPNGIPGTSYPPWRITYGTIPPEGYQYKSVPLDVLFTGFQRYPK